MNEKPNAILIAGPTASGKSALALTLAEQLGGALINADALQVYAELRILTSRPGQAEEARVPHALYGHVSVRERYSVARWLEDARSAIAAARAGNRIPILVGGTGLYFTATLEGLADVPPIPAALREEAAKLYETLGPAAFQERLALVDPDAAHRLPPGDRYRSLRAYEVAVATGAPLGEWLKSDHTPLLESEDVLKLVVMLDRSELYAACDRRFEAMISAGALEEVRTVLDLGLDPNLPAMKAVGVEELGRVIRGEATLEEATEIAKRRTRHYAKRQLTWIRHQMEDWRIMRPAEQADIVADAGLSRLRR